MLDLLSRMFQSVVTPMLWLSLTAAFVAVIVMILRRILRSRIPHQALCVLWLIVFARLLWPVSVETPFSLVPSNITNQIYQTEQEPEQPVEPEAESQPSAVIPDRPEPVEPTPAPVVSTPVSQPQIPATSDPIPSLPVASNPVVSDPVVPEPQPSAPPVTEEEPSVSETPVLSEKEIRVRSGQAIAASVWLLGVAAMLVSGIVSYAKLRRQVYDAIRAEDGVWEHPSLRSPFILGLFRPNIYLPMGIAGPARQFILHHERAHLRRWDHVVKPICWLALAIHWFNPFAWGAFLLMSRDIEAACDESVIRKLGSEVKADYSATLLALATDKRFPAPSPLSFGEGDAEERIKNVLKFKKPVLWVSIAAVVVVAITAVCLLSNRSPRSLDSFYPQVNWEKVESAKAGFDLTDLGNYGWQVELSDEAAAEAIDLLHEYKYWKGLSHLEYDNRIGWLHSVWRLRFEFENGSHITLKYTKEGILVVIYSGALLPEGSALKSSNIHYSVDGGEELASEMLALIHQEEKEAYTENLREAMKEADIYSEEFPLLLTQLMPSDVEFSPDDPLTADDCAAIFAQAEWLSGEDWRLDRSRGAAFEHTHYIRLLLSCFLVGCEEIDWDGYTGRRHMNEPNDIVEVLLEQVNQRELLQSSAVENITHYSDTELAELMDKVGVFYENAEAYDITVLFSYSDSEPVKCTYCILLHDDSFKIVSASCESEGPADDPTDAPVPISALGDLFLSALNDKAEIIDPGLGMTDTLSALLKATTPTVELRATQIAAVDLDDDGIEEILLNLQTAPDAPYGTMILHYSAADGKVYGHSLWARAFMDVKEDGTFSYSSGAATNGVARLSFTPEGCEKQVLLHQDFDLDLNGATDDYYYYRNGEAVTEQEFYSAFESWQSRPNLIWTEYTPENAEAMIRQHFDVTDAGQDSEQDFLSSLPTEIVTYNTLPVDPEEYYLVANVSGAPVSLYSRNAGQETLLVWDGLSKSFARVAHTGYLNLPKTKLYSYPAPDLGYLVVISEVDTGTGVGVDELVCYDLRKKDSTAWSEYAYDWRSVADLFNKSNTLIYDADTNSVSIIYNGQEYTTGSLSVNLARDYGLEDGFTGALVANGDSIRYEFHADDSITVTMQTSIAKGGQGSFDEWRWVGKDQDNACLPMSIGVTGATLTWKLNVIHGVFTEDPFSVALSGVEYGEGPLKDLPDKLVTSATLPNDPEEYYLVAEVPEEDIRLYARNSGSEALVVKGTLWKTYDRRTHLKELVLPQVWYKSGSQWETDALFTISQIHNDGTHYVEELACYQFYVGDWSKWADDAHDWCFKAEHFNRNNTVVYDAETNTFAMTYKGRTYYTQPVGDFPASVNLPDGFTGVALITGQYVDYELEYTEYGVPVVSVTVKAALGFTSEGDFDENRIWQSPDGYYEQSVGQIGLTIVFYPSIQMGGFYYSDVHLKAGYEFPGLATTDGSETLWQDVVQNRIDAGFGDFYLIREDGTLVKWGSPDGALEGSYIGDNHTVDDPLVLMEHVVYVDANGEGSVYALDENGTLWGMGNEADPDAPNTPLRIAENVAKVECGQYGDMFLMRDGTLWELSGMLPALAKKEINGVAYNKVADNIVDVSYEGFGTGAAVTADGELWVWFYPDVPPQKLADNAANVYGYRLFVTTEGELKTWSYNYDERAYSVSKELLTDVEYAVSSYFGPSYAIRTDGTLWEISASGAKNIMDGVMGVAGGEQETVVLKTDGSLWQISEKGKITQIASGEE